MLRVPPLDEFGCADPARTLAARVCDSNAQAAELLEAKDQDELCGSSLASLVVEREQAAFACELGRALRGGVPDFETEMRLCSGATRRLHARLLACGAADETATGLLLVLEAPRKGAAHEPRPALLCKELVRGLSHDLRSPLMAISGFAQVLGYRHRAELGTEAQRCVDNIVHAAQRLESILASVGAPDRPAGSALETHALPLLKTETLEPGSKAAPFARPLLSAAVHELRTPLNSILGFTGSLLMRLPGPLLPEQERQLQQVESAARHMLALVDQLLDFGRERSGLARRPHARVVVQELVDSVLELLQPLARAKGLELCTRMPDPQLVVESDPRALSQILLNLVGNAIKFTQAGEVHVELEPRAGGAGWRLAVVDTGPGIASEDQDRLFQPFERLHASSTQGSGLGLYQAQQLAHDLHGEIRCESTPGHGSRFELSLP